MYIFFFNDTATTEIYTLSLHDALPICRDRARGGRRHDVAAVGHIVRERLAVGARRLRLGVGVLDRKSTRLNQSQSNLVCRLLLGRGSRVRHGPPAVVGPGRPATDALVA